MNVESVLVVFFIFMLFTLALFVLCNKIRHTFKDYGFSSVILAMNTQRTYPCQSSFAQQMPYPSNMPYPPPTMYPPPDAQNITQRSNSPQPSEPNPTSPSLEDMEVPPNFDEAMTNLSKEQKKF